MDIKFAGAIAAAGMKAQSARMRVAAENLANAQSTALVPGGDPFRRKTITFQNELDRALGVERVEVKRYGRDMGEFILKYEPGHPAADANGNVKYPNINPLIELMDMREAQRSFEANLNAMQTARTMSQQLIEILR